ncbi:MAG: HAD family phosphatase [Candidatus Lokiarchaeota archaeon]|nr:HAD family phosphatase [Candidatus Lokiarchaeota archaeon]
MFENYGVIFDLDGVIVDTGPIHYESWVKLAEEIGVKFTTQFFEKTFGQQSTAITRKLVGTNVDQELVEKWADLKELYYREMVKDKLHPLPGVIKLLNELYDKEFKLAVASSGPLENVELSLNTLNIHDYFNVITTAADVVRGKPEPDVFLITAQKLNVEPKNCIVIEDAPVGVTAAKKANMKVIALRTTHCNADLLNADITAPDLSFITLRTIIKLLNIKHNL